MADSASPQDTENTSQRQPPAAPDPQAPPHVEWLNLPEHGTPDLKNNGVDVIADRLDPGDLTKKNEKQVAQFAHKAGLKETPPVDIDSNDKSHTPSMKLMTNAQGKPVVLMNEATHQWTSSYAEKNYMITDAKISERVKNKEYSLLAMHDLPANVSADIQAISEKMGNVGRNEPLFLVNNTDKSPEANSASFRTPEGTNAVVINRAQLNEMKDPAISAKVPESSIWHEEAHLARRDSTPNNFADEHNTPGLHRKREKATDKLAFGPKGSGDPAAFIEELTMARNAAYAAFRKKHPKATEKEFDKAYSNPDHPTYAQRKAYLEKMIHSNKVASESHEAPPPAKAPETPSISQPGQQQTLER